MRRAWLVACSLGVAACGPAERRFPLRAPLWRDDDLQSVRAPCHPEPTPEEPARVSCAPRPYVSPEYWDEADSLLFRPLSEALGVVAGAEATNVNSLDEIPDSSWFTNRVGVRPMSRRELELGGCDPSMILDPDAAADGSWVIDHGKKGGASPGFRVSVPGHGKFLFKADDLSQPEQSSAATLVGSAAYHAVGYNTSCEQLVYFRPSLLRLTPGLRYQLGGFTDARDLDRAEVDRILASLPRRGDRVRMMASAWLPGRLLGPFRYEGTRGDDPNDVVPHENRRELRAGRLLAAWLGHADAREANSMDAWLADQPERQDSSTGRVVHSYLDWGDSLGADWPQEEVTRRIGYSYILDWGEIAADLATLGARWRPWDNGRVAGHETFGYFDVARFVPEDWKSEYANPAFTRMTERDGAWMARILARFTPEMVDALAEHGGFTDPANLRYLAQVLRGRLDRILDRYLTRLSPIADLRVEGGDRLCGRDLAEWRAVRRADRFQYSARISGAGLPVTRAAGGFICVLLPRVAGDGGARDDAPERYVRVSIEDGVATGSLNAYLYDLGPTRGYELAGLERPPD